MTADARSTVQTDWPPFMIAVAPNGARKTTDDHPALPIEPAAIARAAAACADAGAAMIHLHVRDRERRHTLDPDAYKTAIDAIRQQAGDRIVIQITTEAVGMYEPAEQMASVRAVRPEAVSVAIRELAPDAAHESDAADFFGWLARENVMAQYILYSDEDVDRFADLRRRGIVPGDIPFVLFVLGRYTKNQESAPSDLLPFLSVWREPGQWALCAFGRREGACALTAATLGGHSRVGFENNFYLGDGTLAPDNAALVAQTRAGAELIGRPIADAAHVRTTFANAAP